MCTASAHSARQLFHSADKFPRPDVRTLCPDVGKQDKRGKHSMPRITRSITHLADRILSAWEQFRPDKTYSSLTLQQVREALSPCLAVREEIRQLNIQLQMAFARRTRVDAAAGRILRRVVYSVRADPDDGMDCAMYAAMGFVTADHHRRLVSRGRRRAKKARDSAAHRR
jgi:hypothetical protein